jgi:hypothetical protein
VGASLDPVSLVSPGVVAASVAADDAVCSVAWWSQGVLAVSRRSGTVVVAAVPGLVNLLGGAPETFEGCPALASCPRPAQLRTAAAAGDLSAGSSAEGGVSLDGRLQLSATQPIRDGGGGNDIDYHQARGRATARVVVLETLPPAGTKGKGTDSGGGGGGGGGGAEVGVGQRWRLATIGARSPAEMLRAHVDAEEWGTALQLAR